MEFDVAGNREGIGSRLKCLVSVMRFNDKAKLSWEKTYCLNAEFHELFETKIQQTRSELHVDPRYYYSWRFYTNKEERLLYGRKYFDFMFDKTPEPLKSQILEQVKKIVPIKNSMRKINEHRAMMDENTISVCVRTWKDTYGTNLERTFEIKDVYRCVEEHLVDKLFLTSDNEDIFRKFCKRYANRVLFYPKRTSWGDWSSLPGMQDTVAELFISGHAKKMLLSWHSAFTEAQWWFGGAQAEVVEMAEWKKLNELQK